MLIRFLGAARTVTGSSHLITVNGTTLMLDCGLFQGRRDEARRLNEATCRGDVCDKIDAIILSHGHLDHCGRLPMVSKLAGYKGPIYCTPGTADVARVVLEDSAEIQVEDADFLNRRSRGTDQAEIRPLYTPEDAKVTTKLFRTMKLGNRFTVGEIGVTLLEAGHILGSSYVWLDFVENGEKRNVLFTADVGRFNTPIIRDPVLPDRVADVIITESTYGGRKHDPSVNIEPAFLQLLRDVIARKGRLIIPSFAVGRTQTMLWYIEKFILEGQIPAIPVFVDSPMGVELTNIYDNHRDAYDVEAAALVGQANILKANNVRLAKTSQQSREINSQAGPCVIIASSPTCEFGRVLHHLTKSLEKEKDAVLFVGWTPPGTLGRRLQDGADRARIFDRFYEVRAQVTTLPGMSGHADAEEMLRFLRPATGERSKTFVVHGEPDQSEIFAERVKKELGAEIASVPAIDSSVIV